MQTFLAGALADIMVANGMGWAASLAAGMGMLSFDVNTLCVSDPPPLPTVDAARIASYFNPLNPSGAAYLRNDFTAIALHMLWPTLCQCVSGPQPPAFPPMPQPGGYITDNPTLTRATGTPCSSTQLVFESKNFDAVGNITWDAQSSSAVPPGAQWIEIRQSGGFNDGTSTGYPVTHYFDAIGSGGAVLQRHEWIQSSLTPASNRHVEQFTIPAGSATWRLTSHSDNSGQKNFGVDIPADWFCSAAPPQLTTDCCPPDPILEQMIAQVLRIEQQILDALGGSPSYSHGAVHSARTGSASIPVTGLRGMRAHVTAGIPTIGQLPGNPPYEWNLGWMSVMTGDGMIEEKRLTRGDQVWLPLSMPLATTFGYYLNPGIVVDFTELVPA